MPPQVPFIYGVTCKALVSNVWYFESPLPLKISGNSPWVRSGKFPRTMVHNLVLPK